MITLYNALAIFVPLCIFAACAFWLAAVVRKYWNAFSAPSGLASLVAHNPVLSGETPHNVWPPPRQKHMIPLTRQQAPVPPVVVRVLQHKLTDQELLDLAETIPESGLIVRMWNACGTSVLDRVYTPDQPISSAELAELSEPGKILYAHLAVQDACIEQVTHPKAILWLQRMTLVDHPPRPQWLPVYDDGYDPHPACCDHN